MKKNMRVAVLGAGMVGRTIAMDLIKSHEVCSFDIDTRNLEALHKQDGRIAVSNVDLNEFKNYPQWLLPFDFVVTAVPGHMGYACLEAVINSGKSAADISFFPEDSLSLEKLAKERGVTIITDAGVAPGMSNYILGYWDALIKVNSFECYVGGLPLDPQPPFYYKAPFSPIDVIEEYTRPARLMENGKVTVKEALTDRVLMEFPETGTLEAFNTDGLRTLLSTMSHIPNMKEQTLRYPGHLDLILALKQAGFLSDRTVKYGDHAIQAVDFSARLLIDQWKMGPSDRDITMMQVLVYGLEKNVPVSMEYRLYDEFDSVSNLSSMSRTTGYTCTASLELIMQGLFKKHGVFPPELVGSDPTCFSFVINYLKERGIDWKMKKTS